MCINNKKVTLSKKDNDEKNIPFLANIWCKLYDATPKVYVSKNMDVGFTLTIIGIFAIIRQFFVLPALIDYMGWTAGEEDTLFVAACFIGGIFHTPFLVPVLFVLLTNRKYKPSTTLSSSNGYPLWYKKTTDAMLQFCTAYMVYDFGITVWDRWVPEVGRPVFNDDDLMYMAHHFMTTFYMTTTRMVDAGKPSAMMCMFLGECTNPFFNMYLVLDLATKNGHCCHSTLSQTYYQFIEVITAISYVSVRAFIAPILLGFITCGDLLFSETARTNKIPLVLRITYCLMIWAVIGGSVGWVKILSNKLMNTFGQENIFVTDEL